PRGLCIINNSIFVCEFGYKHQIEVFDLKTFKLIQTIGEEGNKIGQFNYPSNILYYKNLLYISDSGNNCIQLFTLDGKYVNDWGKYGKANGKFDYPMGIAIKENQLYVVDQDNYR